ncbi:4Fe-4S binding protein [Desulfofundulus thermocisternus]|uniref:4Fe-4S binding protein n=1 Tax=Desulfofundulus thermocisternus TaxID=42471 RepID=UPI00217D8409|nr:4Fe-4S binding protein [Desulfofundulus thermocisternus]MCS5694714.1 4Fe-4S binding protein [Desulfofundulus thermocisternus]
MSSCLKTTFCGLELKNPVIASSGSLTGDAKRIKKCVDAGVGAVIVKTVAWTRNQAVYANPRYYVMYPENVDKGTFYSFYVLGEWASEYFPEEWLEILKEVRPYVTEHEAKLIVSIMGESENKATEFIRMFDEVADAFELNLGCPYGGEIATKGGVLISQDPELVREFSRICRQATDRPIIAKISAEGGDLVKMSKIIEEEGINGITLTHRFSALEIDIESGKPILNMGFAGYGGPWAAPISRKWVANVALATKLDICGGSGIDGWRDGIAHLMCGAKAIQMCTAPLLRGYQEYARTIQGMEEWLNSHEYKSVEEIIGISLKHIIPMPSIPRKDQMQAIAQITSEKCTGCGTCTEICPYDASYLVQGEVVIVEENCQGCGLCAQMCPEQAVTILVKGKNIQIPTSWPGARGRIEETRRRREKVLGGSMDQIWKEMNLI